MKTLTLNIFLRITLYACPFILLQACNSVVNDKQGTSAVSEDKTTKGDIKQECIPDPKLSAGAALMFGCIETQMTTDERNQVFNISGLRLTKDKKKLTETKGKDIFPSEQSTHIVDLNKDGVDEVVLFHGHHTLYDGRAGRPLKVFIRQASGNYAQALSTHGSDLDILDTKHNGFPDLIPAEGGFEFGVFHYDGKKYSRKRKVKDGEVSGTLLSEISKSHHAAPDWSGN